MSNSVALGGVVEADDPDPGVAQPAERGRQPADERHRHVLDRAGRRLGHRRRDVHRPVPRQQHPVDTGAVAVAHDRAEVARVGDAVDGDEERRRARAAADQLGEVGLGQRGGEGDHALRAPRCGPRRRACRGRRRRPAPGWPRPARRCRRRRRRRAGPSSIQISWTLRRPAMQQLAHGLATLDLLAAEPLPVERRRVGAGVAPDRTRCVRRRVRPGRRDRVFAGRRAAHGGPARHDGDGEAGDALAATERAEALGPPPLTVTGLPTAPVRRSCISARIGASLGRFAHDRAVDVADDPAVGTRHGGDLAQQLDRVGARPAPDRCRGSARRCRRARRRRAARRRRRGRPHRRRCDRRARAHRGTRHPPSTSGRPGRR